MGISTVLPGAAYAQATPDPSKRSFVYLTTGNGFGFQVYSTDPSQRKIITYLDHPYRYLRAAANPMGDGIGRRNLAYDFYFGLKTSAATGWLNDQTVAGSAGDPGYVNQSNIIHAALTLGGVTADAYYFAPFGVSGNVMVALLHAPGAQQAFSLFNFHMGTATDPDMPGSDGESVQPLDATSLTETGPGGGSMVYISLTPLAQADCQNVYAKVQAGGSLGQSTSCSGNDMVPAFQRNLDANGWMAVAIGYVDDPTTAAALAQTVRSWAGSQTADQLLAAAEAEHEAWRVPIPPAVKPSADETSVWRQGETTLRMSQIREPQTATRRNTGMILASLPPGEWHTGWVRDGTYAIAALSRMGHYAEAKAALNFLLNANPVGAYASYVNNVPYRISVVRYYGDGSEQADYSGQPTPNVEIDGWGLVMWAARQYVDASGDVAWLSSTTELGPTVYQALKSGVADALEQNINPTAHVADADSSIWEVHEANKQHFAYTSLAAYRGFCDMATLTLRAGQMSQVAHYQTLAQQIHDGVLASFLDPQGAIGSSIEALSRPTYADADAAAVEAFNFNLLTDLQGQTATATLNLINHLVVSSGGYKRNANNQSDYDNNEWILIDLRMSDALRRAGQGASADALVNLVVGKAVNNFYLLPELYDAVSSGTIGAYTGSIPMVGYGPGAFVMTLLDRGGLLEPSDCGLGTIMRSDAGVVTFSDLAGVSPTGGGGGGSAGPRSTACICNVGGRHDGDPAALPLMALPWLLIGWRLQRRRSAQ